MKNQDLGIDEPDAVEADDVKTKQPPAYQVYQARIPVGKGVGPLWKSRFDSSKRHSERYFDIAKNVHDYYQNTLDTRRELTGGTESGTSHLRRDLRNNVTFVENIIFANAQSMMPHLYTQNPSVTIISNAIGPDYTDSLAQTTQKLVNVLANKKGDQGLGLKLKVRRSILASRLFNEAYIEVGYQFKQESVESARLELDKLAKALEKAKTDKEVQEIEAKIQGIDDNFDFLLPSGPWCRYRRYLDVHVDPASIEEDLSDASYVMIADFISTNLLQVKYGKKDREGKYKSIYKATHVLAAGIEPGDNTNAWDPIVEDSDYQKHGFADSESYERAQYTRVWRVWDKTTRRVYMFNEAEWSWPIYVWDDPYQLDSFFPIDRLWSVIDPAGGRAKPEFAYILDQQDMIDQKNSTRARAVDWAINKIVYNKNVVQRADVEKILAPSSNERALGLDIPDGMNLSDVISTVLPPSMKYEGLFDTAPEMQAIERIMAVGEVMRGGQFRTNTTNQAVQTYADIASARTSDSRDNIEDFVGRVLWKITQLCLQNMSQEQVAVFVGKQLAMAWVNMDAKTIESSLSLEVVGGSTTKPTSIAKKQEAIEMAQALGQFARVPHVVLVVLRMFKQAFSDSFIVEPQEWDGLIEVIEQSLGSGPAGDGTEGQPTAQGGQPQAGGPEQVLAAIVQKIDALNPEQKAALGQALAEGVSFKQVLATLMQGDSNAGPQQPGSGGRPDDVRNGRPA